MNKMEILIVVTLAGTTPANGKVACQTQPDPKAYSAWRIIDGKQCWYRGKRGKAKESLYWEQPAKEEVATPEPLKDRIDRSLEDIAAAQPQPPTSFVPLPPPKPALSGWERLWRKWHKWNTWWWGETK